jgi:uncharacterized protein YecE (DUF72 family)
MSTPVAASTMHLHVGTSGFAYKGWVGRFYPPGTPEKAMLARYATQLDTVEINNTFYRFPTVAGLAAWASHVPGDFCFAIKVPQRITHIKRLHDVDDDLSRFIDAVETLGERLGPLLFLLPPRMPLNLTALQDVLTKLPPSRKAAFEFRDKRWLCDAVFTLLAQHGCAVCFDDALMPAPRTTTDWGYVRLRQETYTPAALRATAEQVLAQPWREAYVYVKHEAPDSPQLARQWLQVAHQLLESRSPGPV